MQKDDIMLFLTAVSDFGEKKLLVIESHSQVIKFQCFGFVAFQLRKEFLHIQGECDFFSLLRVPLLHYIFTYEPAVSCYITI